MICRAHFRESRATQMHLGWRTVHLCSARVRWWRISANSDGRCTRVSGGASTCTVVRPPHWWAGIVLDKRGAGGDANGVLFVTSCPTLGNGLHCVRGDKWFRQHWTILSLRWADFLRRNVAGGWTSFVASVTYHAMCLVGSENGESFVEDHPTNLVYKGFRPKKFISTLCWRRPKSYKSCLVGVLFISTKSYMCMAIVEPD